MKLLSIVCVQGLLLASFNVLCHANYVPNVNDKIRDFCVDDAGISTDIAEYLLQNPQKELIEQESCYLYCVYIEIGLLFENGIVDHGMFQQLKEEGELPNLDLECLATFKKVEKCNEISKLAVCNL